MKKTVIFFLFAFYSATTIAQKIDINGASKKSLSKENNPITTAVPFMTITPDSRSGSLGDAGAATSPDVWSQHSNASKYVLLPKDLSVGISYTPWLENLGIKDINLAYLAASKKIGDKQAVSASLRFFSMGDIPAYDDAGNALGFDISPKEYAVDASYSRLLSDHFVMGITGRFIYSNLGGEIDPNYTSGKSVAADISGTYFTDFDLGTAESDFRFGFNISNIGSKVSYSADQKDFIPTNLSLGVGFDTEIDKHNSFSVYLDFDKLLVPTPPHREPVFDSTSGKWGYELSGEDPSNLSPIQGIFRSFYDAPGGFIEEISEITISGGVEYWYNKLFAIRGGYFHEAARKGNRKYFTVGAGLKLNVFGLDFAYLIPTQGTNSPLSNTFRFSLTFDFDALATESKGRADK